MFSSKNSNSVLLVLGSLLVSDNITDAKPINGNYAADIFFGFSAALLGVSGFESSANYIEVMIPSTFSNVDIVVLR